MKALFSFIAIIFLSWVGVVHILPQTEFAARVHQAIEQRISGELGAHTEIEALDFGLFPRPHIEMTGLTAKKEGVLVFSVRRADVLLNLSASLSKRKYWLELVLKNPHLYLAAPSWWGARAGLLTQAEFMRPLLSFHHTQISNGVIKYNEVVWNGIHGVLSAGNQEPISARLSFSFKDKIYSSEVSLARLDGGKPIAMEFQQKIVSAGLASKKIVLSGLWHSASAGLFDKFQGNLEWDDGFYRLKSRIESNIYTSQLTEAQWSFSDWQLNGTGSLRLGKEGADLILSITDGTGIYQRARFSNIKGNIKTDLTSARVENFSARMNRAKILAGKLDVGEGQVSGSFNVRSSNFTALLQSLAGKQFMVPPHLKHANMAVQLTTNKKQVVSLKATGAVGKSKVRVRWRNNVLSSTWKATEASGLAHQFGFSPFFVSKGAGRVRVKIKKQSKGKNKFGMRANFGTSRYFAQGTMSHNAFDGKVRVRAPFAQGRGKVALQGRVLQAELTLSRLNLTAFPQSRLESMMKQGTAALNVRAAQATLADNKIGNFYAQLHFNKKRFRIRHVRGDFSAGSFEAAADLSFAANKPHYNVALKLTAMDSHSLTRTFFNKSFLEGKVDLTARFSTSGKNKKQWLKNLNGKGKLALREGQLIGFDAALLNQALPQLELFSLLEIVIDYAFNHGKTPVASGATKFAIRKGQLTATPLSFKSEHLIASLDFGADLSRRKLDAQFHFQLPLKPDYPALGWRLRGNFNELNQTFDSRGLERALARDIINGGIAEIKNSVSIHVLPLELQDLLQHARKQPNQDPLNLDLELELDLTTELNSKNN